MNNELNNLRSAYERAEESARSEHERAIAPLRDEYEQALAAYRATTGWVAGAESEELKSAREAYELAHEAAREAHDRAIAPLRNEYVQALAAYRAASRAKDAKEAARAAGLEVGDCVAIRNQVFRIAAFDEYDAARDALYCIASEVRNGAVVGGGEKEICVEDGFDLIKSKSSARRRR